MRRLCSKNIAINFKTPGVAGSRRGNNCMFAVDCMCVCFPHGKRHMDCNELNVELNVYVFSQNQCFRLFFQDFVIYVERI